MPAPSLRSRFWRLCLINIASNLTIPLVGLVDTAMLGHLPELRFLAGVALASLIFDYLFFGLGFLRMTTTGQTAQAQGRDDERGVEELVEFMLAFDTGLAPAVGQQITLKADDLTY